MNDNNDSRQQTGESTNKSARRRALDRASERPTINMSRRSMMRATAGTSMAALGLGAGITGSVAGNISEFDDLTIDSQNRIVNESGEPFKMRGVSIPDPKRLDRTSQLRGKTPMQLLDMMTNNDRAGIHAPFACPPSHRTSANTRWDTPVRSTSTTTATCVQRHQTSRIRTRFATTAGRCSRHSPSRSPKPNSRTISRTTTTHSSSAVRNEASTPSSTSTATGTNSRQERKPPARRRTTCLRQSVHELLGVQHVLGAERYLRRNDAQFVGLRRLDVHQRGRSRREQGEWAGVDSPADIPGTPYAYENWQVNEELLEEALLFWSVVADRYADEPHVVFEPYNEPTAPGIWGPVEGCGALKQEPLWETFVDDFMGPIIDEIRQHQPEQVLLVGVPGWCQSLQGLYWYDFNDAGYDNIAVTWHNYAGHDVSNSTTGSTTRTTAGTKTSPQRLRVS